MSETPKFGGAADDKTRSGSSNAKSRVKAVTVNLTVNGQRRTITIEPRTTLLDAVRENLALTGTKKAFDVLFVGGFDEEASPLGTKGLGGLTAVSVAPAIANAVYHATGKRIRDLPVTVEKLL
jgi:hypothetical protein